jgi:hypothetical protein
MPELGLLLALRLALPSLALMSVGLQDRSAMSLESKVFEQAIALALAQ